MCTRRSISSWARSVAMLKRGASSTCDLPAYALFAVILPHTLQTTMEYDALYTLNLRTQDGTQVRCKVISGQMPRSLTCHPISPQVILVPMTFNASSIAALRKLILETRPDLIVTPAELAWRTKQESRPLAQRLAHVQAPGMLHALHSVLNLWNDHGDAMAFQFVRKELILGSTEWTLMTTVADAAEQAEAEIVPMHIREFTFLLHSWRVIAGFLKHIASMPPDPASAPAQAREIQGAQNEQGAEQGASWDKDPWGLGPNPRGPLGPVAYPKGQDIVQVMEQHRDALAKELVKRNVDQSQAAMTVDAAGRVLTGGHVVVFFGFLG